MNFRLLAVAAIVADLSIASSLAQPPQSLPPTGGTRLPPVLTQVPMLFSRGLEEGVSNGTTDRGGTSRVLFQAQEPGQRIVAYYDLYCNSGTEAPCPNPVTINASLVFSAGREPATVRKLTFGGKPFQLLRPGVLDISTDEVSLSVPAGARVYILTHVGISLPVSTLVATASATGGKLPAAIFRYGVTQVSGPGGNQGESGPGTPQSVEVRSSTGTATLAWTTDPASVAPFLFDIYRDGHLLAQVAPSACMRSYSAASSTKLVPAYGYSCSFTDTGVLKIQSKAITSSGQKYPLGPWLYFGAVSSGRSGEGVNYGSSAGDGSDQTSSPGVDWITSTSSRGVPGFGPTSLEYGVAGVGHRPIVCIMGDSISRGQGSEMDVGYTNAALLAARIGSRQFARPGEGLSSVITYRGWSARLMKASRCTDAVSDYGTNDISRGLQTLAGIQHLMFASWLQLGRHVTHGVFQTTLLPRVSSTDRLATLDHQFKEGARITGATNTDPIVVLTGPLGSGLRDGDGVRIGGVLGNTAANGVFFARLTGYSGNSFALYRDPGLTASVAGNGNYLSNGVYERLSIEAIRVAINDWLVDGACFTGTEDAPVFVPSRTAGARCAGGKGHPLMGVFDAASTIETNAAGVRARDGGLWPVAPTPYAYSEGTHPTGKGVAIIQSSINTARFDAGR